MSVLIPTYNQSALRRATIQSVLAQDFTDFERIVSDDCSTDDTAAVVRAIQALFRSADQLSGLPYRRAVWGAGFHRHIFTANIYSAYILANIRDLEPTPRSFDAVVMVEVLEHLSEADGLAVLQKAERWERQRVIVTTPNGFLPQQSIDSNPYQVHRSGWSVERMRSLGYRAYGMAGWRASRSENRSTCTGDPDSIFCTIRWRPAWLAMLVFELTQLLAYYLPRLAFEVFYVRDRAPSLGVTAGDSSAHGSLQQ